ncbi:hypothetical protein [Laspinema olomoucense]|uniref:Uncharacterized protein n=1 Tax=Laspinema olomoucense D3b TaxID=2953688 RepID=A0ABT2NFP9_9CYAN|nr:hypothetical protein [Laspinema sp. D3b]MCT7981532.1 hypothetical protein [Laspinema sp. D3b]
MDNQHYDAWGQPIPQDTHRAYPSGHSDTLVPSVNQAIQSQKKPKIPQFKGLGKQALIAGGVLGAFWLFSSLITLSSRQSVATPQLELEPAPVEETIANEPPPLEDLSSRRNEAWETVRQSCGVDLQAIATSTEEAIGEARADAWILYAQQECMKSKNCESAYDWLRQQHDQRGAKIQSIALADRLSIRAEHVFDFRKALYDQRDIARALSRGVNSRALSWVATDQLSDSIDDCSDAAKRFESLTRATIEEAQAMPGGDVNEPF